MVFTEYYAVYALLRINHPGSQRNMNHLVTLFAVLDLFILSAGCGSTATSEVAAAQAATVQSYPFTSWEVDPNLAWDSLEVTQGSLQVNEAAKTVTVHLAYDLFPIAFTADIEHISIDECGHKFLMAKRFGDLGVQTTAVYMYITISNLAASRSCLVGVSSEADIGLYTRRKDGIVTNSYLYGGTQVAPPPGSK
jgi:hypothetical protein